MSKLNKPRILVFDIETSPNVVYCWQTGFKLNIGPENIIEERQIICIAYKWSGEKRTHVLTWDYLAGEERDKELLAEFAEVYSEADMVVGHNGDNFDIKWIRTRLLYHGLPPLTNVQQCDTLKECRRTFRLNSNKLDYIAKFLDRDGKSPMSFQDWKEVMNGKKKALNKMAKYCKQDVEILDNVFQDLRPYITNGNIHHAKDQSKDNCPSCGSGDHRKDGVYYTKTGQYQRRRCRCGHNWKESRMLK